MLNLFILSGITSTFALPTNKYVIKKQKTAPDPNIIVQTPMKVDLKPRELHKTETDVKSSHIDGDEPKKHEHMIEIKVETLDEVETVTAELEERFKSPDIASKPAVEAVTVDVNEPMDVSSEITTEPVKVDVTDAADMSSEIPAEAVNVALDVLSDIPVEAAITAVNHASETVTVLDGNVNTDKQGDLRKLFVCQICETTFSSLYWFERHTKKCLPSYQCDQCPKKFKDERSVKRHVRAAHTNSMQCNICGSSFTTENKLKNHIMMIHEAEKESQKCGKVYKNRKSLWKHMKKYCNENITEEDKSEITGKRPLVEYEVASDADSELSDMEVGDRNPAKKVKSEAKLKCVECPTTYNSSRGLRAHKQKHHSKAETKQADSTVVIVVDGQTLGLVKNVDIEYVSS